MLQRSISFCRKNLFWNFASPLLEEYANSYAFGKEQLIFESKDTTECKIQAATPEVEDFYKEEKEKKQEMLLKKCGLYYIGALVSLTIITCCTIVSLYLLFFTAKYKAYDTIVTLCLMFILVCMLILMTFVTKIEDFMKANDIGESDIA